MATLEINGLHRDHSLAEPIPHPTSVRVKLSKKLPKQGNTQMSSMSELVKRISFFFLKKCSKIGNEYL